MYAPHRPNTKTGRSRARKRNTGPLHDFPSLPGKAPVGAPVPIVISKRTNVFTRDGTHITALGTGTGRQLYLVSTHFHALVTRPRRNTTATRCTIILITTANFTTILITVLGSSTVGALLAGVVGRTLGIK